MLVLSRKVGEQVIVNDNICVTVTAVHGSRVQLGFSAPQEVSIRRQEIDGWLEVDEGIAIEQLEAMLRARLIGRGRDLRVVVSSAGIVLQGRAITFYAKQLAQREFMQATARPLLANEILVLAQPAPPQDFIIR